MEDNDLPFDPKDLPPEQPPLTFEERGQDRLTIVGNVYHQHPGEDPLTVPFKLSRWLESDEQPWIRRHRAKPEGALLLRGCWIPFDEIGLVVIHNLETTLPRQVQPTEQEKEEEQKKCLELTWGTEGDLAQLVGIEIPPGMFTVVPVFRGLSILYIASSFGETRYVVHVYPK